MQTRQLRRERQDRARAESITRTNNEDENNGAV